MSKLNNVQTNLIEAAAANGGAAASDFDHRTLQAMIKRGLIALEAGDDGEGRVLATDDGRTAVGLPHASVPEKSPPPAAELPQNSPEGSKTALLRAMLERAEGATVAEMSVATGWFAHSVRGFMSGTLKKKLGLTVTSEKTADGRRYQLVAQ